MKLRFFILSFFFAGILWHQRGYCSVPSDSAYIERFNRIFSARMFADQTNISTGLSKKGFGGIFPSTKISSDIPFSTGISLNLYGFGFTYKFRLPGTLIDSGSTGYHNIFISTYQRHIGFEVYYRNADHFPTNPLLKSTQMGGNFIVILNKKFSYNAAFLQTQRQKKSEGSFILQLSYLRNQWSEMPGLMGNTKEFSGIPITIGRTTRNGVAVLPGYGFTSVYKILYFSNLTHLGPGLFLMDLKDLSDNSADLTLRPHFVFTSKTSVGINSKNFFAGVFYNIDYFPANIHYKKTVPFKLSSTFENWGATMGFRINGKPKPTKEERAQAEKDRKKAEKARKRAERVAAKEKKKG